MRVRGSASAWKRAVRRTRGAPSWSSTPSNRLLRMAVGAANLFATMILKSGIEIMTDPTAVVAEAKLTAPPRNQPFI